MQRFKITFTQLADFTRAFWPALLIAILISIPAHLTLEYQQQYRLKTGIRAIQEALERYAVNGGTFPDALCGADFAQGVFQRQELHPDSAQFINEFGKSANEANDEPDVDETQEQSEAEASP